MSTIVRKDLLTAAIGSAFFEPAGTQIAMFDHASSEEPAAFIAFYLLGGADRQLIEMLEQAADRVVLRGLLLQIG